MELNKDYEKLVFSNDSIFKGVWGRSPQVADRASLSFTFSQVKCVHKVS